MLALFLVLIIYTSHPCFLIFPLLPHSALHHSHLRTTRVRRITASGSETRIVATVREVCDRYPEDGAYCDIIDVVSVIFAAGDCDQRCTYQGREGEEDTGKVGMWAEDVELACQEAFSSSAFYDLRRAGLKRVQISRTDSGSLIH